MLRALVVLSLVLAGCLAEEPVSSDEPPTEPPNEEPWATVKSGSWAWSAAGTIAIEFEFPAGASCTGLANAHLIETGANDGVSWSMSKDNGVMMHHPTGPAHANVGTQSVHPSIGPYIYYMGFSVAEAEARTVTIIRHEVVPEGHPDFNGGSYWVEIDCDEERPYKVRYTDEATWIQHGTYDEGVGASLYLTAEVALDARATFTVDQPADVRFCLPIVWEGTVSLQYEGDVIQVTENCMDRGAAAFKAGEYALNAEYVAAAWASPHLAVMPFVEYSSLDELAATYPIEQ